VVILVYFTKEKSNTKTFTDDCVINGIILQELLLPLAEVIGHMARNKHTDYDTEFVSRSILV
jgi:hypothetical protein